MLPPHRARPAEAPSEYRGGLSGLPCRERSTELVALTRKEYGNRFTLTGCGGILSAEDALEHAALATR